MWVCVQGISPTILFEVTTKIRNDIKVGTWLLLLSLYSCPTLCDPIDSSPPGSPGPGILQARTLEWVAISFSNAWKWKLKVKSLSSVRLFATPWTAAYQAPLPMGFSRQKYWSGVPLPSPGTWKCPLKGDEIHTLYCSDWTENNAAMNKNKVDFTILKQKKSIVYG